MLVMTRVRVPDGEGAAFRTGAEDLLGLLAEMSGFVRGISAARWTSRTCGC